MRVRRKPVNNTISCCIKRLLNETKENNTTSKENNVENSNSTSTTDLTNSFKNTSDAGQSNTTSIILFIYKVT
jgi:hypothetical protein